MSAVAPSSRWNGSRWNGSQWNGSRWCRPPVLLFLAVAVVYLPGLWNGFLWIDHSEIVGGAMLVRDPAELVDAFVRADNAAGYHRPVYRLIHTFDHALWGLEPAGYYLSSLLLHALNVALVCVLLGRSGFAPFPRSAIAALWGLHPVHTAVAGLIHAKADLFGLTCALAVMLAYERLYRQLRRRAGPWVVGLAAFAAGVLTKELVFLVPVLLALHAAANRARQVRAFVVALTVVAAGLGALHVAATAGIATPPAQLGLGERLLTFADVYLDYIGTCVWPWTLSMSDAVRRFSAHSLGAQVAILAGAAAVLVGQGIAAWRCTSLRKWVLLYNLTLLPVAQVVPILHFRADRYLYVPSLAFVGGVVEAALLLAAAHAAAAHAAGHTAGHGAGHAAGHRAGHRAGPPAPAVRRAGTRLAAAVCLLFVVRSEARLAEFRDDISLFSTEMAHHPGYREGLTHLGRGLERRGQLPAATRCYETALLPDPDWVSYVNRGALLVNLTRTLIALGDAARAYALATEHAASVHGRVHRAELAYNRAVAAYNLGRFRIALGLLQAYAADHPRDAVCVFLVGAAAAEVGEVDVAKGALRRYLALRHPDPARNLEARRILAGL